MNSLIFDPACPLHLRLATLDDAEVLTQLINRAYRGDSSRKGWTTEADLLTGSRINAEEVRDIIRSHNNVYLVGEENAQLIACVNLTQTDKGGYLGMFVIEPSEQARGLGKSFMQAAEAFVKENWKLTTMWLTVITVRSELIAYYERRGYVRTGRFSPFPVHLIDGAALVENLEFEEMEKSL
jgi:GNAT superfamily N-acetyltransferase